MQRISAKEYKNLLKKKNKYKAQKTIVDGITFDSKKEANYYKLLKIVKESGALKMFIRQVPFDLPGGIKYRLDFMELWADGLVKFTDTKGYMTQVSKNKIKQVEDIYNIKIDIV